MNIKDAVNAFDTALTTTYNEYVKLHEELNPHRGKPIQDTNLNEVNRLLKEIQEKFVDLYPALHLIATKHEFATNAVNSYNEFIEIIKKAGAQSDADRIKT